MARRGVTLVNVVPMEEYLRGVVPWEIGRPEEPREPVEDPLAAAHPDEPVVRERDAGRDPRLLGARWLRHHGLVYHPTMSHSRAPSESAPVTAANRLGLGRLQFRWRGRDGSTLSSADI